MRLKSRVKYVSIRPVGRDVASRRRQVGRVNRADAVYHGVINNIQGAQDERVNVEVDDNWLLQQSVRIHLEQLLILAASPHLYLPLE